MKQYITLSMALIALVLAGCAREESFSEREGDEIVTIKAVMAESNPTKTVIQEGATSVLWEPAEEISVYFKGVGNKFTSQNTELAAVADFTGTFSAIVGANEGAGASNLIWGLYPYRSDASSDGVSVTTTLPSSQKGRAGSFAQNTQITLAASTGLNLAFYNVTGGLRFSLTREDIKSVSFEGNKKEPLAGTVKLAFSDGIPVVTEVLDSVGRITLNAPNGGAFQSGVWYYIVALPTELSEGFTISFNTGSSVGSRRSSNAVTVKRGIFGSIADVDKGVDFLAVPDAVDLGLPSGTLWASFNVGANSPEEIGERYAWGETETKSSYTWSNYKWCNGSSSSFTKYCTADGKTKLDDEDDVVQVKFGDGWHMPDNSQIQELLSKCTWTSVTLNGVNGYRVTGPNSNTLFFPCNGQWEDSGLVYSSRVYIWSSECYANANTNAYRLQYPNSTDWGYNHKHDGLCVRAVKGKFNEEFHPFEPEYVDLGLSVKWATCNLGAETPEDYGDYYSWGEIIPKDEYSWSTYIWCNGDYNKLTKYCPTNKTDYWDGTETPEGKTVLDLEDDAARANWGGSWRLPSDSEWTELRENCTWTWTTQNGVKGRLVTSNINGNSIFLPVAGNKNGTSLSNAGSYGNYWSYALDASDPEIAWNVGFTSSYVKRRDHYRYLGFSIRPVCGELIYVNDVALSNSSLTMMVGSTSVLSAIITPANATEKSVLWKSSDDNVATVDESGLVNAVAEGTATITVTTVDGNKTATCSVEVKSGIRIIVPPDNEIWYSSITGETVDLTSYPYTLVSNTYEKGIGRYVFSERVTQIGNYYGYKGNAQSIVEAFSSVIFPAGITTISSYQALAQLRNTYSVILPVDLSKLGVDIFCGFGGDLDSSIEKHIYFLPKTAPLFDSRTFWNMYGKIFFHYPEESDYSTMATAINNWYNEDLKDGNQRFFPTIVPSKYIVEYAQ